VIVPEHEPYRIARAALRRWFANHSTRAGGGERNHTPCARTRTFARACRHQAGRHLDPDGFRRAPNRWLRTDRAASRFDRARRLLQKSAQSRWSTDDHALTAMPTHWRSCLDRAAPSVARGGAPGRHRQGRRGRAARSGVVVGRCPRRGAAAGRTQSGDRRADESAAHGERHTALASTCGSAVRARARVPANADRGLVPIRCRTTSLCSPSPERATGRGRSLRTTRWVTQHGWPKWRP
jgi:hypothetical protein